MISAIQKEHYYKQACISMV